MTRRVCTNERESAASCFFSPLCVSPTPPTPSFLCPPPIARGGDGPAPPREWGPPDEGGVFPSQRPPSELDLGRSLESEALPRPPPEFAPPEPAPTPRVLPETAAPDEEEEPGDIPPPLPLREPPLREPPLREPEELPWREPEPEPVEES